MSRLDSHKPSLVTLAMIALLAATIAGTWLLVRYYYPSSRQGTRVLQEMRREGLSRLWPQTPFQRTFAQKDSSGRIEARMEVTREALDGNFAGEVMHTPARGAESHVGRVHEEWYVGNDMSEGKYLASYLDMGVQVSIVLKDGIVSFACTGMKEAAAQDAPANYVPEGLERLVVRRVAETGRKASFCCVMNEPSISAKDIVMERLTMTPLDRHTVEVRYEGDPSLVITYHLDAQGEITRTEFSSGQVQEETKTTAAPEAAPSNESF